MNRNDDYLDDLYAGTSMSRHFFDRGKETRAIARERVGVIPGRRVFVSKKNRQDHTRKRMNEHAEND
jgi:hypothetical protein